MLNTISWQQYLTAIVLLSAAWYAYVGLRYYQPSLNRWLTIHPKTQSVVPTVASRYHDIMGTAKSDAGTVAFSSDELVFAATEPDDISDQTIPAGPADELLAEAMVLVQTYGDSADKGGFLSLFRLLLNKYEIFSDEISLPAVIRPLREFASGRLAFSLNDNEWPSTFNHTAS